MIGWTQETAIHLCREIEKICPPYGCHVALTGGCLYKDGERKDLDLVFYRIRQVPKIDIEGLLTALEALGIRRVNGWGFCYKAVWLATPIDMLFPEEQDGQYEPL